MMGGLKQRQQGNGYEPISKQQQETTDDALNSAKPLSFMMRHAILGSTSEYVISTIGLQKKSKHSAPASSFSSKAKGGCLSLLPRLRAAFVPEPELVAPEFWTRRRLLWLERLLSELKGILTIQAMYVAMGVGNEAASAAAYVVMQELNSVAFRVIGLGLGGWLKSASFAANAKLVCCINVFYSHIAHGIFDLWLLHCPQHLGSNLLLRGALDTAWTVVNQPAQAAICNHIKATKVAAKMAEVDQQNTNQEKVLQYFMIILRWLLLTLVVGHVELSHAQLWVVYWALGMLQIATSFRLVSIAAMPTFNAERLNCVCEAMGRDSSALPTPAEVSRAEAWIPRHHAESWRDIVMGVSGEELIEGICSMHPLSSGVADACASSDCKTDLCQLLELHASDKYIMAGCFVRKSMLIMLKEGATPTDQIRAWWHCHRACHHLRIASDEFSAPAIRDHLSKRFAAVVSSSRPSDSEWHFFLDGLRRKGWWCDQVLLPAASEWRLTDTFLECSGKKSTNLQLKQVRKTPDGSLVHKCFSAWDTDESVAPKSASVSSTQANMASSNSKAESTTGERVTRCGWLYGLLVPIGYPETVAPEYMQYQLWDTLQVMTADLRGIIIQQAGVIAVGVGIKGITPLGSVKTDMYLQIAATTVGLIAGLISDPGKSVASMKSWRVYNTLLSYYGAAITLLQGIWPHKRLHLSIARIMIQDLMGPSGRGAGMAMVMHLSNESLDAGFRADVSAKEANQDRVLGLLLMPCRFLLLFFVGTDFYRAWTIAASLSIGHIIMNAMAVRVLKLRTLNNERLLHLASAWTCGDIAGMTPTCIATKERILPGLSIQPWSAPSVGVRLENLLDPTHEQGDSGRLLCKLAQCHENDAYILGGSTSKVQFQVALKAGSSSEDHLRAWLHAFFASKRLKGCVSLSLTASDVVNAIVESHDEALLNYPGFLQQLEISGWAVDGARLASGRSVVLCAGPWLLSAKAD